MLEINRVGINKNKAPFVERTRPTPFQLALMEGEVKRLRDFMGGISNMSKELGFPYWTINSWCTRGKIPQYVAEAICKNQKFIDAGFTRESLRPDVTQWRD